MCTSIVQGRLSAGPCQGLPALSSCVCGLMTNLLSYIGLLLSSGSSSQPQRLTPTVLVAYPHQMHHRDCSHSHRNWVNKHVCFLPFLKHQFMRPLSLNVMYYTITELHCIKLHFACPRYFKRTFSKIKGSKI